MEHSTESDEKKRSYHSHVRERQAEETRRRILEDARSLFESRGYAATTLEAIAELALVRLKRLLLCSVPSMGIAMGYGG